MEGKSVVSNNENHIKFFYIKYAECRDCNNNRGLKRHYDNKEKTSHERRIYLKNNEDKLLPKQNDSYIRFDGIVRTFVEL